MAELDRLGDATTTASEALTLLAPFIERYPNTFGPLGHAIQERVLAYSEAAGLEPDKSLLERVDRVLAGMAPAP